MNTVENDQFVPSQIIFHGHELLMNDGPRTWIARGQNFYVQWAEATKSGQTVSAASDFEMIVVVLGAAVTIAIGDANTIASPRSVCVIPAGKFSLSMSAGASCAILASHRSDLPDGATINSARYAKRDPRLVASVPPWTRLLREADVKVYDIDKVSAPKDNPRLKMFQTETMSINWSEYVGPRDARKLSPHSHSEFEQGSLALQGEFIHHLRWPWKSDSTVWKEDQHARLDSPSLLVIPAEVIHTSEGIGGGNHLLIDVFSPPRMDFIAKNWMENGKNYAPPA